jgi:DNA-binding NarL/FixJ family response regulator
VADTVVSRARNLHRQARWGEACALFLAADAASELGVEDVELLAEGAQMSGRHAEAISALERAFRMRAAARELDCAATAAFWLFTEFLYAGEVARAGGWVARLRDLTGELDAEAEPGWLLVTGAYRCIGEGRHQAARALLSDAVAQGRKRGDVDLAAFGTMLTGRSLLMEGRVDEGLAELDEAMLCVISAQTSPRVSSNLYCSGIGTCEEEALDFARTREWAIALEQWMAGLPLSSTGTFMTNCRVYRATLLRRRGDVQLALSELESASRELEAGHGGLVAGHAWYELGETHRLLGNDREAESAYRRAAGFGESAQPGLGLLRLRQGDASTAETGIRRALAEAERPQDRCRLLPAAVTIRVAAMDSAGALEATTELGDIADALGASAIRAEHAVALGELALAGADPARALPSLRRAATTWRDLDIPYEVARTSVLIARACRTMQDEEGARIELEMARETFTQLGARTDLALVQQLLADSADTSRLLTPRELEVLALVTAGRTNRQIATQLFLSERTVHRHLSNIFDKLGVASRTEAAACALQRQLVR